LELNHQIKEKCVITPYCESANHKK